MSKNKYLLYINSKKCLDAAGPGHMAGRYTNEGTISGLPNNARFSAALRTYTCAATGREYASVIATKDINIDEEILGSYGKQVKWSYVQFADPDDSDSDSDSDYMDD